MSIEPQAQTRAFEAEVKQILHLVTHSLYSNKEIFLRELVSNASDAADKLRYAALSDSSLYEDQGELEIYIDFDAEKRTITIRDNGIGMTRDEAIENLGTIAQSGTRAFKQLLDAEKSKDSQLIGQFGVGFYSAFVVADRVEVRTRRAGQPKETGVSWSSAGEGEFEVKNIEKTSRGTEIILHLKSEEDEFLNDYKLRSIIKKYSDHIMLPVKMKKAAVPTSDDEEKASDAVEYEIVNQANALWAQSKSEISKEQYHSFYKHIAHDFEDPLAWAHNRVEGKLEYTSLLFLPKRAPFDLWNRDMMRGLKLYVKRVFIMDDVEHLMPNYLRFVKGVIDSNDLPLNVSRELLQSNRVIESIKSGCTKRVLSMLENMAENDVDQYSTFWQAFGAVIKEGPAEDFANKDRIAKLLRFSSTQDDQQEQRVSLADYVSRMQPQQKKIYYVVADSFTAAKNSPLLEVFRKKGIEVLLMSDRVDEWLVAHLNEFDGKTLQSISKGALDLGEAPEEEKEQKKAQEEEYKDYLEKMQASLQDQVKAVRLTDRLVESPACVVFEENEMSGHMQRLLAQAGQEFSASLPILEINPDHALIKKIKQAVGTEQFDQWASVMLSQALLSEGEQLKDPAGFVKQLNTLLLS